jgi:hypothetical protein
VKAHEKDRREHEPVPGQGCPFHVCEKDAKSEELTTETQRHREENTEKRAEPIEKGRERADP